MTSIHPAATRELRLARDLAMATGGREREAQLVRLLRSAMHVISNYPLRCAPLAYAREYRGLLLRRLKLPKGAKTPFPWRIVYRVTEKGPRIIAVEHTSDRPGTWQHRR